MVKAKIVFVAAALLLSLYGAGAQSFDFEWDQIQTDASRTGVSAPNASNILIQ